MDKDFSNILHYPPGEHQGIIVVKLYRLKVADATKLFLDAINDIKPEDIRENLVIIDRGRNQILLAPWSRSYSPGAQPIEFEATSMGSAPSSYSLIFWRLNLNLPQTLLY